MNIIPTEIQDIVIIEPKVFGDERGYFMETYTKNLFHEKVFKTEFIQDNESLSSYGVLRGLHYQLAPYCQSKLVRVISGTVLDIAVDIRSGSPTFGKHVAVELSGDNKRQLFVPRGFAHGFVVLSDTAIFVYKCDNYYAPSYQRGICYNDTTLNIDWRIPAEDMIISGKDRNCSSLVDAELFNFEDNLYA